MFDRIETFRLDYLLIDPKFSWSSKNYHWPDILKMTKAILYKVEKFWEWPKNFSSKSFWIFSVRSAEGDHIYSVIRCKKSQ